jgi:hypothetical protein
MHTSYAGRFARTSRVYPAIRAAERICRRARYSWGKRPACYGCSVSWSEGATALLNGPRGRRLCLALIDAARLPRWRPFLRRDSEPDLGSLAADLEAAVSATDLTAISSTTDELALLGALSQSVRAAMYWQEPDDEDRILSRPEIYDLLEPVARSVSGSPAARWWSTGVHLPVSSTPRR